MTRAAVLRNYSNIEEALVVCATLQDAGFDAVIDNLNHATLEGYLIPALGGIPVRLPESQLQDARGYLNDMAQSAEERLLAATGETIEPIKRRRLRAWLGFAIVLGFAELIGFAILWLLHILVPHTWVPQSEYTVSMYWRYSTSLLTPSHSPVLGLLLLLVLSLMIWNEIFELERAKKQRLIETGAVT